MKARWLTMTVFGLLTLAGVAKVSATAQRPDTLEGTWVPVAVKDGDETEKPEDLEKVRLTITGNKFKLLDRDFTLDGTFQLNSAASPKAFNAIIPDESGDLHVIGIYKLEGETLTVNFRCFETNAVDRPRDFDTASDDATLIVWKRAKS